MFTDIQLSKDLQNEYISKVGNQLIGGIEFSAEILTNGTWPIEANINCSIPPAMKACTDKFTMFYKNKHQNRNLSWLWQVGTVELKPVFVANKNHQLVMNVFQATVCMLFNEHAVLTFADIE